MPVVGTWLIDDGCICGAALCWKTGAGEWAWGGWYM